MHVQPHDSTEHLQRLRRGKEYQAIAMRRQVIILAKQGRTALQIGEAVGLSRRPVQDWVGRYNADRLEGLYDRRRTGQPTKLPADQVPALKRRLLAGPTDADAGVCTLRGSDVQRILRQEFGVAHSLSAVYKLLHRLGMSCLKPRPRHRKHDEQAMQQWLDDAPSCPASLRGTSAKANRSLVPGRGAIRPTRHADRLRCGDAPTPPPLTPLSFPDKPYLGYQALYDRSSYFVESKNAFMIGAKEQKMPIIRTISTPASREARASL